jgi:hypothetical protein
MPLTYLDGQNNFHIHVDLLTSHPMPDAHLTLSTKLRSLRTSEQKREFSGQSQFVLTGGFAKHKAAK